MVQLMREVSVGRMQIGVVDMNRVPNSSFGAVLEFTVSVMPGVAVVVAGRAYVVLHMRRMVVGHRHRRDVAARTGAANGNDRVHRTATMSGVARLKQWSEWATSKSGRRLRGEVGSLQGLPGRHHLPQHDGRRDRCVEARWGREQR